MARRFDPLAVPEPRRPEGRPSQDARPVMDVSISMVDTEPGMDFNRLDFTCEEFLLHFVRRQIQCPPPDALTSNRYGKSTRQRAFQVFKQNLPHCVFHDKNCVNSDTLMELRSSRMPKNFSSTDSSVPTS